jgi:drug/metabolite transporter (DMT)-like permease
MTDARFPGGWRAQFVLLAAIWGSSFVFIKVLGERWPPLWVALGRVCLGAITLVVLTFARRERLRLHGRTWLHLLVVATLANAIPFTLFAYGEQHVSSIVAGLWNATTPLWVLTAVLFVFAEERLTRDRVFGLLIGFVGALLVLGPWHGVGHGQLAGNLACGCAALCYGLAFPYTRRYLTPRADSATALAAGQLVCATAILAIAAPLANGLPTTPLGLAGVGSLLSLGVLSSGVAFALNYAVIRAAGAAVASTVTYLIPVFSTLLGVVVLGETLSWNEPLGAAVLIAGIAITQRGGEIPIRAPIRRSAKVRARGSRRAPRTRS